MRTLCLFIATLLAAAPSFAGDARIPFTLTSHNNIAVHALLNRTDPLTLMLHTAASDIDLTEDAVKRTRSLKFEGAASAETWGGRSDTRFAPANTLEIGPLRRDRITVWEDKNSGQDTDGKFGLDFFAARFVEIDYDNSELAVHDRLPAKAASYARVRLENRGGELFVEGRIRAGGRTYATKFLLHSGYAGSILLDDAFAAASGIGAKIKITGETALKDSFDNTIKVKKGILPAFTIGNVTLKDVPVGFFEGKLGQQSISILGAEVLKRFNLIIDKKKSALYLKRRT